MIGILCSNKKLDLYTEYFHSLMKSFIPKSTIRIIVFTLSDINIPNGTVNGSLISEESIRQITIEIPRVIYNFSSQKKKADIKKLRLLHEIANISFINEVNNFNQWMLMEMLSSSQIFKYNLFPYKILNKNETDLDIDDKKSFLLMNSSGSSFSKVAFVRSNASNFEIYRNNKLQSYNKKLTQSILKSIVEKSKYLYLSTPELLLYNNQPLITKFYLQKDGYGRWNILTGKVINFEENSNYYSINTGIYNIVISIVQYIEQFIPSLGNCNIDLIFDLKGNPYFLHFGGWDEHIILQEKNNHYLKSIFLRNMIHYAMHCVEIEKGD